MVRMNRFLILIVLVVASSVAYAAPADLDTFNAHVGFVTSSRGYDDSLRAITFQADDRIVVVAQSYTGTDQSRLPCLVATEDEIRQFFSNYVDRHTQKDIDGLLALFSNWAVQNQRDGFDEIKKMYLDLFNQSEELRFEIEDMRIAIYWNGVEAMGHCEVDQILKRGGQRRVWEGQVRWILVRENGALKIRYLDDALEGLFHRASLAHFISRSVYYTRRSPFGQENGGDLLAGDGNGGGYSDGTGAGSGGSRDGGGGGQGDGQGGGAGGGDGGGGGQSGGQGGGQGNGQGGGQGGGYGGGQGGGRGHK